MANPIIQPSRALIVYKSDAANVPYPAPNTSGTCQPSGANQLVDITKNFVALNVYAGDIVYNTSIGASATVTANPTTAAPGVLSLNSAIFGPAGQNYIIYQSSPMAGGQNTGAVLYVGGTGDVRVTTAGGDIVTFFNVQDGAFLPVQVIKVWSATSATDILALW
jgi:hypothetical protein